MQALYKVIQASVHAVQTPVDLNGVSVVADVPSLVVQLQPESLPNENSVIKMVFPGQTEQAPFIDGATITVTFEAT